MDDFLQKLKKLIRIVLYGLAISQSDCRKGGPYQLSSNNYYLLTGCKGRTRKYKPKVFHTARACEGCLENQGLVFPGTARAPS